jgi:hypothetical protein
MNCGTGIVDLAAGGAVVADIEDALRRGSLADGNNGKCACEQSAQPGANHASHRQRNVRNERAMLCRNVV